MKIGDKVKVIDKNDMNYGCIGKISKREIEYDIIYKGLEFKMVKVDFGKVRNILGQDVYVPNEVPYSLNQLKEIRK